MAIASEPYLFFNGNCREAMEFYQNIFGGKLTLTSHGEAMGDHADPKLKEKIINSRLEGGEVVLMASDDMGEIPKESARISLSLTGEDESQMRKIFDSLADGGQIKHPLEKQFWGDVFGDVRDKFGIIWMVDIVAKND